MRPLPSWLLGVALAQSLPHSQVFQCCLSTVGATSLCVHHKQPALTGVADGTQAAVQDACSVGGTASRRIRVRILTQNTTVTADARPWRTGQSMTQVLNQLFGKSKGFQSDVEFWHGAERSGWLEKQGRLSSCST